MTKQIYFYTFPALYEDQIKLCRLPLIKIGETTQKTTDQRIKQQDTTACAQVLENKGSYITPFGDKEFHKYLESLGYKRSREDREWFYITVEDAKRELFNYRDGVVEVKEYFTPRAHQAWVNQLILKRWKNTYNTIIQPLNLCARFGKTLQALSLFKDSGLQVMIVAAHWLAANESFVRTVNKRFDIAADITIIKPVYEEFKAAINKGQRVLIDVSLHKDAADVDQKLINALQEYQSLIYIDEADYGAWRECKRETAAKFIGTNNNLVCVATGTNIDRALIGTRGHIEAPITVAYRDLIEAKRGEGYLFQPGGFCSDNPQYWQDQLSDVVDLDSLTLDAGKDLVDELNDLTDEKRANMKKVFDKRNSHIQTKIIKSLLFDEDYGADVFGMYADQYGSIEHPAIMMFIPGKKTDVNNLVKIGKSIAPHYNWIALHGDDYTNRTAEKAVENAIEAGGEKTVIVSCGMGARSFSVANIISVINCKDGGSVGAAVQQGSRCLTPGCDKTVGLVVNYSFNTERISSFDTDLISTAIQCDPSDTEGAIRRVFGVFNFFNGKDEEGRMIKLTPTDFLEFVTSVENLNNMGMATIDIESYLSDPDKMLEILKNIKVHPSTNKETLGMIDKAITYIQSEEVKKNGIDDKNKAIRDLVKKIRRVVECTSNTYYLAPYQSTFKDCLSEIASNPDKNTTYNDLVGVDAEVVYNNIVPFLNESIINMIINKADKLDSMDNFSFASADHPAVNLFDL
jgi:hypothetical protein